MPELDAYARSNGPLPQAEWTASVYRNPANGGSAADQLRRYSCRGSATSAMTASTSRSSTRFAVLRSRQTDGLWSSRFFISTLGRRMRI